MMTSYERVKAAIRFERTDRPPVIPEVAGVTAVLKKANVRKYVTDGAFLAECQLAAQEHFRYDAVIAFADLCVEAEAIGCELKFPEDNYPYVTKCAIDSIDGLSSLSVPDPLSSGRMPEVVKAVEIMKNRCGCAVPVVAHVLAPMTIAARIIDIEKMLYMIVDRPDDFKRLLSYTLDVALRYARALIEAGADCIIMFDPAASPAVLPPRLFKEFELPCLNSLFRFIKELNSEAITWYSVAGPTQDLLKDLESTALDIMTIDYLVPLDVAFERSSTLCFNGNVKSISFTEAGPDEIYGAASRLLETSLDRGGFILGSGCEVPPDAKPENVHALVRAAEDISSRYGEYGTSGLDKRCVTFHPYQKKVWVHEGTSLMDVAGAGDITIPHLCQKAGVCGSCVVQVESGEKSDMTAKEKLVLTTEQKAKGYRLACQTRVSSDMDIFVPRSYRIGHSQRLYRKDRFDGSVERLLAQYPLSPAIKTVELKTGQGPGVSDIDTVLGPVADGIEIKPELLQKMTKLARLENGRMCAVTDRDGKRLLNIAVAGTVLGVALDIGTTTIAAYLHDLKTGAFLGSASAINPQSPMGDDVMTRAAKEISGNGAARGRLRRLLVDGVNRLILNITREAGVDYNNIYHLVAVGNAVMHHSFLGLDLKYLVRSPFVPVLTSSYEYSNNDTDAGNRLAMNANGRITCPPIIGSFIGSDISTGLIAVGFHRSKETVLFIDLGTNGEIALGNKDRVLATSIAAGPAFEMSYTSGGSTAAANIIYEVDIDDDYRVSYKTIDNGKPAGYCGSALIDTVASFLKLGILDERGHFVEKQGCMSLDDGRYILLPKQETAFFEPIVITAGNIEEVQKAKAAVKAAITVITGRYGITLERIDRVILTGAFGMNLRVDNAARIGLIPEAVRGKVEFMQNAAGAGARLCLLSTKAVDDLNEFAGKIEYIHAATDERFNDIFIDSMFFRPTA
ncbi:MAG: DUF4445 domain-containing protein [Deltaproteobacteria bacterium]|nr:DUF4445 domain-containing protein [Deltaproteobacteria bacterium]